MKISHAISSWFWSLIFSNHAHERKWCVLIGSGVLCAKLTWSACKLRAIQGHNWANCQSPSFSLASKILARDELDPCDHDWCGCHLMKAHLSIRPKLRRVDQQIEKVGRRNSDEIIGE
jgi:hypothetical protein